MRFLALFFAAFLFCSFSQAARRLETSKCPTGTYQFPGTRVCICEKSDFVCVRKTSTKQINHDSMPSDCLEYNLINGTILSGFDITCSRCLCVDKQSQCELVPSESPVDPTVCENTVMWPNCNNRLLKYIKQPAKSKNSERSCRKDISRGGTWMLPCGTPDEYLKSLNVHSPDFPSDIFWKPSGCFLGEKLSAVDTASCLQQKNLVFIGDSTLRGIASRLATRFSRSGPDFISSHNYWHVRFRNKAHISFQYFPPQPDTAAVPLWQYRRNDAMKNDTTPQFIDYFANLITEVKKTETWSKERLYITVGGLHFHQKWAAAIEEVVSSPLWDSAPHPVVIIKSQGQRLSPNKTLFQIHQENRVFKTFITNFSKPWYRWFETEALTQPFWPHLVRSDHCLCHWHVEPWRERGVRLTGPINTELLNVWLNTICSK